MEKSLLMTLLLTILLFATAPIVTITSLTNNQTVQAGTITLSASVSYSGTINKVVFLKNGVAFATDYTASYSTSLSLTPGTYNLSARAFYNSSSSYRTTTITINVIPNYETRIAALEKRVAELEKPDTVSFDPLKFSVIPKSEHHTQIKLK